MNYLVQSVYHHQQINSSVKLQKIRDNKIYTRRQGVGLFCRNRVVELICLSAHRLISSRLLCKTYRLVVAGRCLQYNICSQLVNLSVSHNIVTSQNCHQTKTE